MISTPGRSGFINGEQCHNEPGRFNKKLHGDEMMELFVNGNKVDLDQGTMPQNMGQVVTLLSDNHVPLEQVITEVFVNGQLLSAEEERALDHCSVEEIERFEVKTAKPRELARQGLEDGLEYMDRLMEGLKTIASDYRKGDYENAGRLFIIAIEGMQWFASIVAMSERYSTINYRRELVGGSTIADHYKELGRIIGLSSRLQQNMQWNELAALFEDKLVPHFECWKGLIRALIESVQVEPS